MLTVNYKLTFYRNKFRAAAFSSVSCSISDRRKETRLPSPTEDSFEFCLFVVYLLMLSVEEAIFKFT
jgi:hypothetical protein